MADQKYIDLLAVADAAVTGAHDVDLLLEVLDLRALVSRMAEAIRELTGATVESPKPQANADWGYFLEDGKTFITVAKLPLQNAGHEAPPFTVTRPDGKILNIIEKPDATG